MPKSQKKPATLSIKQQITRNAGKVPAKVEEKTISSEKPTGDSKQSIDMCFSEVTCLRKDAAIALVFSIFSSNGK